MRIVILKVTNIKWAQYFAPWAVKFQEIKHGYIAFESINDYYVWSKKQCCKGE